MLRWIFVTWFGLLGFVIIATQLLRAIPSGSYERHSTPAQRRLMIPMGMLAAWASIGALLRIDFAWYAAVASAASNVLWLLYGLRGPVTARESPFPPVWDWIGGVSTALLEVAILVSLLTQHGRAAFRG